MSSISTLLSRAWGQGEEATLAALDDLLRQSASSAKEKARNADYAFTHHKIQEVVYEALPRHCRWPAPRASGVGIGEMPGLVTEARAVELAHHFEQPRQFTTGLTDKAVDYLLQAGRQAERQSANQEAIGYFQRGLEILRTVPETPERRQRQLDLQFALTVPTTVVCG